MSFKMNKEELKQKCLREIDKNSEKIINLGKEIYKTPELGYKEFETSKKMQEALKGIGLTPETGIAYTGCKVVSKKDATLPTVAVIGELDSIKCPNHKDANELGNVHACGHHVQLANVFGACIGILKSGVMDELSGNVEFIAIPSEECVDYEYRSGLIEKGIIKYVGGKQEALYRGDFDGIDMFLQCHMEELSGGKKAIIDSECNGFITKTVTFIGKAAHAGFAPHDGINALNMAELALNNIHAARETFKDEDKIRVSAVLTKGGDLVNVVPDKVTMDIMVRAFTIDAMIDANKKVSRALKAGAFALGGTVEIKDKIGYLPLKTDKALSKLYKENMIKYGNAKPDEFIDLLGTAGSTDLGDISQIMPCMHIWAAGISGGLHTADFRVKDENQAFILPAKMLACSLIDLLYGKAEEAKNIIANFQPKFTKEEYFKFMEDHTCVDLFDGSNL